MTDSTIAQHTLLTCTNPDCPCEIRVVTPCPHGDQYTCACGHSLVPTHGGSNANGSDGSDDAASMGIGERAEAEGIVDQQAVLVDDMARAEDDV